MDNTYLQGNFLAKYLCTGRDNKIIISLAHESNINDNADGHSDDYGDHSEADDDGDGGFEKDGRGE